MLTFENFELALRDSRLIEPEDTVLIAVSGGLDSVVLLDLCVRLKDVLPLELAVCHVHHGLRGDDADKDQAFVEELARKRQLPCYVQKVNTPLFARKNNMSIEDAARTLRYRAFEATLQRTHFDKVALAHTASDQAETVLDHLLRGSGVRGMAGMPERRGPFVRPLLAFERTDLEAYASTRGLTHREDQSNREMRHKRNRIRHELLPYLRKNFNPRIDATLVRTARIFSETEQYLQAEADSAFKSLVFLQKKNEIVLDIEAFLSYLEISQKYILRKAFAVLGLAEITLNFDTFTRCLTLARSRRVGKKVPLTDSHEIMIDHDGLVLYKPSRAALSPVEVELTDERGEFHYADCLFRWELQETAEMSNYEANPGVELFDAEPVGNALTMEPFRAGDRFIPLNFHGHRKISDYFTDSKIPLRKRGRIPVLRAAKGVMWICGHCMDDRYKITENTRRVLKLEMTEGEDGV